MSIQFSKNVSPAAQQDIVELANQIKVYESGRMSDDAFRKFRLARGVYGQRQAGVQMIRIKLPYGRVSADQLVRIADCSDKYATGNLHATTRQDIQLHFVKLADSPALWAELEDAQITLREACGNTVRNVTASPKAGIDPEEPFDVTPYAHAIFEYFLRNPICQDMGRKFKMALSSSEKDSAFAFMHDVGLIPRIQGEIRGFKVLIGGGLGAQPYLAQTAYEFLEEQKVIPFIEAFLRVFDRYGERTKRHKARSKYLLQEIGLEAVMQKIQEEWPALKNKEVWVEKGES
jgi:sulfite reductase (ferredoxin)